MFSLYQNNIGFRPANLILMVAARNTFFLFLLPSLIAKYKIVAGKYFNLAPKIYPHCQFPINYPLTSSLSIRASFHILVLKIICI